MTSAPPTFGSTGPCDRALDASSSQRGVLAAPHPIQVFQIDLDTPSLLSAEVSDLAPRGKGYGVRWLDASCRPLQRTFALHPAQGALAAPPGRYYAAVYGKGKGEYQLSIDTSPWIPTDANGTDDPPEDPVDEWEELIFGTGLGLHASEDDPPEDPVDEWEELVAGTGIGLHASEDDPPEDPVDEWEELVISTGIGLHASEDDPPEDPVDEWEELVISTGIGLHASEDDPPEDPVDEWEELVVSTSEVARQLRRLCALRVTDASKDDIHGDTPLCATPIRLGGQTVGSIQWDARGDRDAFLFVVPQRARVLFASQGTPDLHGRLFSVDGNVLVAEGQADPAGFFLTAEIPAGRYLLRVHSAASDGAYDILHGVLAAGWDL